MSMPQPASQDPHAPGPVSGGPPPYDQQPPPHQPPGVPPNAPPRSGGAGAAKPPVLMIGAIASGVLALLWLLRVVGTFMGFDHEHGFGPMGPTFVYAAYFLAMAVAAGVGAGLAFAGNDFGRVFAAAVGGAAMWEAANWWQGIVGSLVSGHGVDLRGYPWFPAIVAALGGFVGIAVVATMAMPAISTYVAEKRKKPAGVPPAGPGMPPPPGGPQQPAPAAAGQVYGGTPPAGGQVYGGQPPAGPPPGGRGYGGPPAAGPGAPPPGGQVYGGPPPTDPGAPPPAGPPPAGPQY